jgi:hypothetical protein
VLFAKHLLLCKTSCLKKEVASSPPNEYIEVAYSRCNTYPYIHNMFLRLKMYFQKLDGSRSNPTFPTMQRLSVRLNLLTPGMRAPLLNYVDLVTRRSQHLRIFTPEKETYPKFSASESDSDFRF